MGAPSYADSPEPSPAGATTELLRSRIAILLGDPAVARRASRRLARAAEARPVDMAGSPPCLRAAGAVRAAPLLLVKSGRCRSICRSVDCLCGRYPRILTDREIEDGRRLEALVD
jgi:hypothetical protein